MFRRVFWNILIFFLCCFLFAVALEVIVGKFLPQPVLDPPLRFSKKYGFELAPDALIVHEQPGAYRFEYSVNSQGHRGKSLDPSNEYRGENIIILGDAYSFGVGVNEGDEYAAVLADELQGSYNVVNLGIPGWGLAQQIRKFYEFGRLFNPRIVVVQFSSLSPSLTLEHSVARVENGRFFFKNIDNLSRMQIYWSLLERAINKSQLYNFITNRLKKLGAGSIEAARLEVGKKEDAPTDEALYCDLLEAFSASLAAQRIHAIFLPVNGHLKQFPRISGEVVTLDLTNSMFHYFDSDEWFGGIFDYGSPEGADWGKTAHAVVGKKLAGKIRALKR